MEERMDAGEFAVQLETWRIDRICECGKGRMRPTGLVLTVDPPQYPHACSECSRTQNFGTTYPRIEYR